MRAKSPQTTHPNIHLEADYEYVMLDWSGVGQVPCKFDGGRSHVHPKPELPGLAIDRSRSFWETDEGTWLQDGPVLNTTCALGRNQTYFQVAFDNRGGSAAAPLTFYVAPFFHAPGAFVKLYSDRTDLNDASLSQQAPAEPAQYTFIGVRTSVVAPPSQF